MGFFSWKTQDTNKSICNRFSGLGTFSVTMYDNKGNTWVEDDYEGYGIFGGKDYHELLAEMNGFNENNLPEDYRELRNVGIALDLSPEKLNLKKEDVLYPNLVQTFSEPEGWSWVNKRPEHCEYQGYFYEYFEGDDDDDYIDEDEEVW